MSDKNKISVGYKYWINPLFYLLLITLIVWGLFQHIYDWLKESYIFVKYLIRKNDWM
jgi:hypothetical protein